MGPSVRVAVIDVGSNSIKLLVARRDPSTGLPVAEHEATVEARISVGIGGPAPRLGEEGMRAGLGAIRELLEQANARQPQALRIVATSAVRDAANGGEFAAAVREATGRPLSVLSGDEEAGLVGAGLLCDPAIRGMDSFFQADLGGGSLELVAFREARPVQACSLQLGAVRLTEELVPEPRAPIGEETMAAVVRQVRRRVEASGFRFEPKGTLLVGTGGALVVARRVVAAEQSIALDKSDSVLTRATLAELRGRLCAMTADERAALPGLPANRADVLPTALAVLETLLDLAGCDRLTHSFYNLRYGVARELLEEPFHGRSR